MAISVDVFCFHGQTVNELQVLKMEKYKERKRFRRGLMEERKITRNKYIITTGEEHMRRMERMMLVA